MKAILALLLAVAPGSYAWWAGRRLVRLKSDPTLPERFLGRRSRVLQAAAVAAAVVLALLRPHAIWALPLLAAGMLTGSFPARRAILEETWTFGAYAGHVLRLSTASVGFWILLALAPTLIPDLGPARSPMAVVIAAVLLVWSVRQRPIFLALVRARPLQRPDLAVPLAEVAARSPIATPRLHRVGTPGGRWANAFAVASLSGWSVVFTETLLEQVPPDELAAVFAQEVAHLERLDRARLLAGHAVVWAAIAVATGAIPLARPALGVDGPRLDWAWALVVLLSLALYGTHRKAEEAGSDRRAAALCGNAETLVRAIVRLHALSRFPRRRDPAVQRPATHPSLVHRVQAIRKAAGVAAAGLEKPVVVRSTEHGRRVLFEPHRVHWMEGVLDIGTDPAVQREWAGTVLSVAYEHLTDLRVRTSLSGPPRLLAADRKGRSWSVPLQGDDVASAQAAIDLVQGRLVPHPTGWAHHPALGSLLSTAAALASIAAGQFGAVLIPALIGIFRPSQATLAALGTTSLATGLLALRRAESRAGVVVAGALAALLVFGAVALVVAALRARAERERRWRTTIVTAALLGVFALVAWAALAGALTLNPPALRLHQAALARPGAAVALIGLAAALAFSPRAAARWAALLAALLSAGPIALGSQWFLWRYARDPLLADPPACAVRRADALAVREARIGSPAAQLRVSPSALRFALRPVEQSGDGEDRPARRFGIRSFSGPVRDLEAEDVAFLNDLRVLALFRTVAGLELRAMSLEEARDVSWTRSLPPLRSPVLDVDPALGDWRLTGEEPESRDTVVLSGRVGDSAVRERRWLPPPRAGAPAPVRIVASEQAALAARVSVERPLVPALLRAGVPLAESRFELWALGTSGAHALATSGLEVGCARPPIGHLDTTFTCTAFDGERTLLWSIDAQSGALAAIGSLPGHVFGLQPAWRGRLLARTDAGDLLRIDPVTRDVVQVQLPPGAERPLELVAVGESLTALAATPHSAVVTVYQLAR